MNIKGRFVTIRAIEKEDLKFLKEMLDDEKIETMTVGDHLPISLYQQEQWYTNNIGKESFLKYMIETPNDGAVGLISLEDLDWKNRSVCVGLKLMEKKCSTTGVGIDAFMAILRYVFDELQMQRAWAVTLEYNQASLNMQKLCGFVVEGKNRKALYKHGQYHDLVLTSLLREEYYKMIEEEEYWT